MMSEIVPGENFMKKSQQKVHHESYDDISGPWMKFQEFGDFSPSNLKDGNFGPREFYFGEKKMFKRPLGN